MSIAPQASSAAGRVDAVFFGTVVLCAAVLVCITALLIYFAVKYSKKRHPRGEDIEGNTWLEIAWTAIPTLIFLAMFVFGWTNFNYMREVPREAMEVEVTGRQWAWSFKYPNGRRTSELLLAVNKPVKLNLRSLDVIHGFFIPAFRIKMDVVPGKENYTWFAPTQLGSFDIECTVICGVSHANMLGKVVVVPVPEFEKWYFGNEESVTPVQTKVSPAGPGVSGNAGLSLLTKYMCLSCHSTDGSVMVGPTFRGLFGTKHVVLDPGGKEMQTTVDDAYLVQSIQDPVATIVKGYPPIMPKNELPATDLRQIVEYIKTLK
jgi:cytochrome c oxidase subunit II